MVTFAGRSTIVGELVGMRYVATLLASPYRAVDAQDLDGSPSTSRDFEALLDDDAVKQYVARLAQLDDLELLRDLSETEATERDWLRTTLRRERGPGDRRRRHVNEQDRSRIRVAKAIDRAISRIAEQHP